MTSNRRRPKKSAVTPAGITSSTGRLDALGTSDISRAWGPAPNQPGTGHRILVSEVRSGPGAPAAPGTNQRHSVWANNVS